MYFMIELCQFIAGALMLVLIVAEAYSRRCLQARIKEFQARTEDGFNCSRETSSSIQEELNKFKREYECVERNGEHTLRFTGQALLSPVGSESKPTFRFVCKYCTFDDYYYADALEPSEIEALKELGVIPKD